MTLQISRAPARDAARVVLSGPGASMAIVIVDLHAHTCASDGAQTPTDVVARAARRGVAVLAITDHDTVAGLPEAIGAGRRLGVRVIPGVELSVRPPRGQLHLVAYLPTPDPPQLLDALGELQRAREIRAAAIADKLAALGVPIDMVTVHARVGSSVGRPHLADALVAAGHATDRADAFARYLGDDGPAYVPHDLYDPATALGLVADAGGVAALAHPGSLRLGMRGLESYAAHLRHLGLWGIEVYRAEHTPEQHDEFARIARRLGLIATGGSDYHGPDGGRSDLGDTGDPALPPGVADLVGRALRERVASTP
jgi:3',5'-nucleoside bisphosphate phosphatase